MKFLNLTFKIIIIIFSSYQNNTVVAHSTLHSPNIILSNVIQRSYKKANLKVFIPKHTVLLF